MLHSKCKLQYKSRPSRSYMGKRWGRGSATKNANWVYYPIRIFQEKSKSIRETKVIFLNRKKSPWSPLCFFSKFWKIFKKTWGDEDDYSRPQKVKIFEGCLYTYGPSLFILPLKLNIKIFRPGSLVDQMIKNMEQVGFLHKLYFEKFLLLFKERNPK
jgi:hypothetical protein